ncbi:hypothetical protein [Streptomyces tendae]|uniref:hypothetical protein n=1 Tax=Streptomyces tendae TaxID=1932 RepID=UPI003818D503
MLAVVTCEPSGSVRRSASLKIRACQVAIGDPTALETAKRVPIKASPAVPSSIAIEGAMPTRTRRGVGRPSQSFTTTLSVAVTPNPAPVITVCPAWTAASCVSYAAERRDMVRQVGVVAADGAAGVDDPRGRRGERSNRVDDHGGVSLPDLRGSGRMGRGRQGLAAGLLCCGVQAIRVPADEDGCQAEPGRLRCDGTGAAPGAAEQPYLCSHSKSSSDREARVGRM